MGTPRSAEVVVIEAKSGEITVINADSRRFFKRFAEVLQDGEQSAIVGFAQDDDERRRPSKTQGLSCLAMSIELYLFRHGRSLWNLEGRYQGQAESDLDSLGKAQALAVAQRCRDIDPKWLYTSDLRRCIDVADQIAEVTGLTAIQDKRLRERDVGRWSGLTRKEVQAMDPDDLARWYAGDDTVRPGGGESFEEMRVRVASFFDSIRNLQKSGDEESINVVAVTHGGWIRAAAEWVLGDNISRRSLGVVSQGSMSVFVISGDSVVLEALNDRGHLLSVESIDQEPPTPPVY